jgi:CBS domain containing-hemolysin-like protein
MIILVLLSAFFSMTETVYSTTNTVRLTVLAEEGKKQAQKALWIADHYDRTLTTILVGNNLVNISLATISVTFFTQLLTNGSIVELVSTLVTTIVVLIFGEITPKTIAKEHADSLAIKLSGVVILIIWILTPLVIIFSGFQKLLHLGKDKTEKEPQVNEAELEAILDTMEEEGAIESEEVELINNILDLNDREVKDIMTPRPDIIAVSDEMDHDEIKAVLFNSKLSRIPVYHGDKDNIIGILFERDFLTAYIKRKNFRIKSLLRPVKYVSTSMKVNDLIHELQKTKMHMAIVSGEYGEVVGLVTMEDALEELVGEIYDEHDDTVQDEEIVKIEENIYEVSAEMPVEDLFEILELGKAPDSSYTSVGGFLYSLAEDVPSEGEELEWHTTIDRNLEDDFAEEYPITLKFTILSVIERRIMRTKLEIIEDEKEQEDKEN